MFWSFLHWWSSRALPRFLRNGLRPKLPLKRIRWCLVLQSTTILNNLVILCQIIAVKRKNIYKKKGLEVKREGSAVGQPWITSGTKKHTLVATCPRKSCTLAPQAPAKFRCVSAPPVAVVSSSRIPVAKWWLARASKHVSWTKATHHVTREPERLGSMDCLQEKLLKPSSFPFFL